jgi:diguanylate cyclase (GGDEF)-like protein
MVPKNKWIDVLVVIHSKDATLLGRLFVLEHDPTRVGCGESNHIILDDDAVSRHHARFEQRGSSWFVVDDGSAGGTFCNDQRISRAIALKHGDRVMIGPTIFKFLSGSDEEAQRHEEITRMTIMDDLTQIHNKRYLYEAIEREIVSCRLRERALAILFFEVDEFRRITDVHGHAAGDVVLQEVVRVVHARVPSDGVFARFGGEVFTVILPGTSLESATALAEALRQTVSEHLVVLPTESIRVTVSIGAALFQPDDRTANDLIKRADERLSQARNNGRDRVCS